MEVHNKVIVVTGAGSGIGRELVLNLLSKGARVVGVDINDDAIEQTRSLIPGDLNNFLGIRANITDSDAVHELPVQVEEHFGSVDGLINNAGIVQPFLRLNELDLMTIERVIRVNLLGPIYVTKAFLPHLLKRPIAHIVNLSSMGGFVPVPGQTIYGAAKAGVKLMTEGLASELIGSSVKISVVCPGAVATNILANSGVKGPKLDANESSSFKPLSAAVAASIIVRGIESDQLYIFVGKDASVMDKLYRLAPIFAARTIAKKMSALLPSLQKVGA